jgi:hypothetical protein
MQPGGVEEAFVQGQLFFHGHMPAGFTVEKNGPELSDCVLRAKGGAEERISDPEGERPRRMVRPLKEALVVPLDLPAVPGVIDLPVKNPHVVRSHNETPFMSILIQKMIMSASRAFRHRPPEKSAIFPAAPSAGVIRISGRRVL